ncbi:hydrolase [beta proteobacterium AAP99]|nr:hydrolase [beta proteobacterium AAP99]
MLAALAASLPVLAQTKPAAPPPAPAVLFENVRVFDGKSDRLSAPSNVLVVGNVIRRVSTGAIEPPAGSTLTRVAGNGRTLMPGLIDGHTHIMFADIPQIAALTADIGFVQLAAGKAATDSLMRGFTTLRDMGGPAFGLKRAIDVGILPGPRIWPSGAMISQSGGHADFRLPTEMPAAPGDFSYTSRVNAAIVADGVPDVLKRVREQLALGASQIKLTAGGGVSSVFDPLDVTQFSPDELRAAVNAAENWGTYVGVHAYTPRAIRAAVDAGVRVIEHATMMDEATAKLMAEKGTWVVLQPFLDDEDATPFAPGSANRAKQLQMFSGTDTSYKLAKQYRLKAGWGTDTLFDAKIAARQAMQLTKLTRWYTPAEVLQIATRVNGELLALSGLRSPYPGKLGVVEEGALADLLLVEGDPIANIKLIEDPARNFVVIMKDGRIYKNTVK